MLLRICAAVLKDLYILARRQFRIRLHNCIYLIRGIFHKFLYPVFSSGVMPFLKLYRCYRILALIRHISLYHRILFCEQIISLCKSNIHIQVQLSPSSAASGVCSLYRIPSASEVLPPTHKIQTPLLIL